MKQIKLTINELNQIENGKIIEKDNYRIGLLTETNPFMSEEETI